jgi:hypothetical protein
LQSLPPGSWPRSGGTRDGSGWRAWPRGPICRARRPALPGRRDVEALDDAIRREIGGLARNERARRGPRALAEEMEA